MNIKQKIYLVIALFSCVMLLSCGNENDDGVYITPYGKRYHHSWCKTIQGHSITCLSIEDAKDYGRTPCHVCY